MGSVVVRGLVLSVGSCGQGPFGCSGNLHHREPSTSVSLLTFLLQNSYRPLVHILV